MFISSLKKDEKKRKAKEKHERLTIEAHNQ